jgi:trimeric autotransporter adhesin
MKSFIFIFSIAFLLMSCGKKSTSVKSVDPVGQYHQYSGAGLALEVGATEQYSAIVNYSDDHWENKSADATWSTNMICPTGSDAGSSGNAIATVSATGLVTGVGSGIVYIVAVYSGYTGCFQLTVSGAALVSIAVTPANPSIVDGTTQQFTATATYADATTRDITSSVTSTKGLASGESPGSVLVIATLGSISGSTTLTVTNATLLSIAVTPVTPSVPKGSTQQFTATGTYSDGSTQDITATVTWASTDVTKATIAAGGLSSTLVVGTTTIRATSGAITGTTVLTVTAAVLSSIAVTPNNTTIALGLDQQYTATGTYTDGSTDTGVATIDSSGYASSVDEGVTLISAVYNGVTGSTNLTIGAPALVSIAVTPPTPSKAKGLTQQFTATGTYTDGSTTDITSSVTWTTSDGTVTTVNASGLATAVDVGTATITATSGAISDGESLTVTPAALVSISVVPNSTSFSKTATKQYTAIGTYTDSTTSNITASVTWSSSSTSTATISNGVGTEGLASGVAIGFVTFTATSGSIHGSGSATITP